MPANAGERTSHALERLRERAQSYERDARVLHDDGDHAMSAAYRAIADELRKCADETEAGET